MKNCIFFPQLFFFVFLGELTESKACIMFNKPIERMMIRYDRQPSDFSNLLEPAFDSLNDKNGQKLTRRIVNNFGGIVFERPSSGTYLTLSRYFEFRYNYYQTHTM